MQPLPDPVDEYRKGFIDGQIDMRDRPEEQEPVDGGRSVSCGEQRARQRYLRPPMDSVFCPRHRGRFKEQES